MKGYNLKELKKYEAYTICNYIQDCLEFYDVKVKNEADVKINSIIIEEKSNCIYIDCYLWSFEKSCWEEANITDNFYRRENTELYDKILKEIKEIKKIKDFADFEN